ncbi:MAG: nitroreductase family protein [Candidatus Methanoplasma sp.]|jgi:nitroreductase|nr:nitroreductase family protein [Candidatus Methanoplasma sp.]
MERKDLYDAIWKRRSVRKYLPKDMETEKADALRGSLSSLNKASGLSMELVEDSGSFRSITAPLLKNVRAVVAVKGRTDDPDLFEKCGYYGEQIVLEATALGLGTCWVAGSFNKKCGSLEIGKGEEIVCTITVGHGAEEIDASTAAPAVPHRKTRGVYDFLEGNTNVPGWIAEAMKAVQFAPTAMNNQRTRFVYADGKLSAYTPPGKLNMIDFGITKLHFELAAGGKFSLGTPGEFKKD